MLLVFSPRHCGSYRIDSHTLLTIGLTVLCFTACFSQSEPTGWRGPNRDGHFPEKNLLTAWPAGGPQLLWKYENLGTGYYTNGHGRVFAFSATDGNILWQRDLMNECLGTNRNWGFVDNLIVDGDKIYCTPSGKMKNVVALDRLTGKTIWEYDKKEEHLSSHRTPIYRDGYLLGLDDETTGSVMLRVAPDGSGAEVAWRNPELFSVQGEAVVLGDRIYGPGNRSKLVCADWKTGRTLFSEPFGSGIFVLIAADDLIYSYDVNGNFKLLKALDDRMQILGSFRVPGGSNEHFSHPVIRDGRLYIRHENSLFVYDISRKS